MNDDSLIRNCRQLLNTVSLVLTFLSFNQAYHSMWFHSLSAMDNQESLAIRTSHIYITPQLNGRLVSLACFSPRTMRSPSNRLTATWETFARVSPFGVVCKLSSFIIPGMKHVLQNLHQVTGFSGVPMDLQAVTHTESSSDPGTVQWDLQF